MNGVVDAAPKVAGAARVHGGADARGAARFDFSTNSNACGPCPVASTAVRDADARCYPDPLYTDLRARLAAFHGVDGGRILLAASASEFIFRVTSWVAQGGARKVSVPRHAYGDYGHAALAWGLTPVANPDDADLVWACEPSSPLGGTHTGWPSGFSAQRVLDCAYAPLRLSGESSLTESQLAQVWQLWTPNKALGLTGVRGAYVVAPLGAQDAVVALERLASSWPLGAHGVALLHAWVLPEVQRWLGESLHTLRQWKAMQVDMLQALGWSCLPSDSNFFCAQPALSHADGLAPELSRLRAAGIKLRDATSFGLPGHVRLSVQPPLAQDALREALGECVAVWTESST